MQDPYLNTLYFSATGTTLRCVETVADAIGLSVGRTLNLADRTRPESITCNDKDVVLVGAPVYGGRIPPVFAGKLKKLQGNGARTIAMVVYGNRDYDDALLELTDILRENGFLVVAAGAFIAQHSIFPKAGMARPDRKDLDKLIEFGRLCRGAIARTDIPDLLIKGHRPYKKYGGVPLHPLGNQDRCKRCGICSDLCPVNAIDKETPCATNAGSCISCGRCIVSCPFGARQYRGLKYKLIDKIFTAVFAKRKEPEFFA